MELLKLDERPAEFAWGDIVIRYRTRMTAGDKYELDTSGKVVDGDKITYQAWDYYKNVIRIFVVGWSGVTENGAEAPYSFESLLRIPIEKNDKDLIMELGYKIAVDVGLIKKDEPKIPNDSSGPSNG